MVSAVLDCYSAAARPTAVSTSYRSTCARSTSLHGRGQCRNEDPRHVRTRTEGHPRAPGSSACRASRRL